jgi:hypothetical protein
MKCSYCGGELNPKGAWVLGNDDVWQECYGREVDAPPEETFGGIAIGVSMGLGLWFGLLSFARMVTRWIVL